MISTTAVTETKVRKAMPWWAMSLILTNLFLVVLLGWAYLRFGSIPRALSFAAGVRLIPDSTTKSFGYVASGSIPTVSFRLSNMASRPMTLLGVGASCSCMRIIGAFPLTIPPGGEYKLDIEVHTLTKTGDFMGSVNLFTDVPDQPSGKLWVVGNVGPKATSSPGARS